MLPGTVETQMKENDEIILSEDYFYPDVLCDGTDICSEILKKAKNAS